MIGVQACRFVQSQADVFIGGRLLDPHGLGIYTTALFLTQILAAKFVPPLNEVAFAAYSRIQARPDMIAAGLPQIGAADHARRLALLFRPRRHRRAADRDDARRQMERHRPGGGDPRAGDAVPSLQILFAPATTALGRPGIAARNGLTAALIAPVAVLVAVWLGVLALAACWLVVFPSLLAISLRRALPVIGVDTRQLIRAVAPPALAATAMALVVTLVDRALAPATAPVRLAILVASGGAVYGGWLLLFGRALLAELAALVRRR